jgi:hypothetical protein
VIGLAEAREKHMAARKELKAGRNPAAEKQAKKRILKEVALTFEKAAVAFLESRRENGYEGPATDDIYGRLQKHIFPALGSRPLKDITALEILDILLVIKRRGVQETVKRCRQYLSQIFQ